MPYHDHLVERARPLWLLQQLSFGPNKRSVRQFIYNLSTLLYGQLWYHCISCHRFAARNKPWELTLNCDSLRWVWPGVQKWSNQLYCNQYEIDKDLYIEHTQVWSHSWQTGTVTVVYSFLLHTATTRCPVEEKNASKPAPEVVKKLRRWKKKCLSSFETCFW